MNPDEDYLAADDAQLMAQCRQDVYKSSGPGGQHRNKVSSAVRLRHGPTGITAHGDDSRSQHENRLLAIHRLRMNIACQHRRGVDLGAGPPAYIRECTFIARGGPVEGTRRFQIGVRDHRFWRVAAYLLDLLEAHAGKIAAAAETIGISTSNFAKILESDRHLLAAAQEIRKRHGLGRLS